MADLAPQDSSTRAWTMSKSGSMWPHVSPPSLDEMLTMAWSVGHERSASRPYVADRPSVAPLMRSLTLSSRSCRRAFSASMSKRRSMTASGWVWLMRSKVKPSPRITTAPPRWTMDGRANGGASLVVVVVEVEVGDEGVEMKPDELLASSFVIDCAPGVESG